MVLKSIPTQSGWPLDISYQIPGVFQVFPGNFIDFPGIFNIINHIIQAIFNKKNYFNGENGYYQRFHNLE
jgi:hypothetical protein